MASLHYRHRVRPTVGGGITMAAVLERRLTADTHRTGHGASARSRSIVLLARELPGGIYELNARMLGKDR